MSKSWDFRWSPKLKMHHETTKKNALNILNKSSRIKIPKNEEQDLIDLEMKIKEIYSSYKNKTIDIKTVDIASKVVVPGGITITTITTIAGIVIGSPLLAVGGGVISLGLGVLIKISESKMKSE